jgi:hypothetical protein
LQVVESVRVLDKAQANTRKALDRAVDVVGLKSCVEDVAAAMTKEEWEQAADSIQRYIHVAPEDSVTEVRAYVLASLTPYNKTKSGVYSSDYLTCHACRRLH